MTPVVYSSQWPTAIHAKRTPSGKNSRNGSLRQREMDPAGSSAARSTGTVIHEHARRFHLALDLQPAPRRDGRKFLLLTGASSLNPDSYSHGPRTVCKRKLRDRGWSTAFPLAPGGAEKPVSRLAGRGRMRFNSN